MKQLGANVLGIGDASCRDVNAAVKDSLTEYYQVSDMHDYDQLMRACGYYTHHYGKIDRFESLNEIGWLPKLASVTISISPGFEGVILMSSSGNPR